MFWFCQFCDVCSQNGNDPHEDLAKFCYTINLKVEPSIFWQIFTLLQKQLSFYNWERKGEKKKNLFFKHKMCFPGKDKEATFVKLKICKKLLSGTSR